MTFMNGKDHHNFSHGQSEAGNRTGAYKSWVSMKDRCNPINAEHRPNYAGAGISVCERWAESFESFYADMGDRPAGCSIDRINPLGNYEPSNCRWATKSQQARNKLSSVVTEVNGELCNLIDLAEKYGIPASTISRRYSIGLRGDELIGKGNRLSLRVGSLCHSSKLNESLVGQIKQEIRDGARNFELARRYGVSGSVISEIRHKKLWAHVECPVSRA